MFENKCLLVALAIGFSATSASAAEMAFRDAARPVDERVADLVGRLTLEEKAGQMSMSSPAIPRLGIPEYDWWNEALHGVARAGEATVFPQALSLAATWDPELHHRIATVISTEARAKHHEFLRQQQGNSRRYQGLTIWSPNINIFRDPRWGRGHETYGEDPFLTGKFAVAFVRGLQGDDPRFLKTVSTVKHFAVHSGPESQRHTFDARIPDRDFRETYLPAFETSIREGKAMSLMAAYNAVAGVPCSASTRLLDDILRKEWGFQGAVVGDVDSVQDIYATHKYVQTSAEASALAVKAGNDLCSGTTFAALPDAVRKGLVSEAEVDKCLARLLRLRFLLGMFDAPATVPWAAIPASEVCKPEHDALALEAARKSLVLLKNDGTLPWKSGQIHTLAVLGPTANRMSALLGNYAGTPKKPVTILDGLRRKFEPQGVSIIHEPAVPLVAGFQDDSEPLRPGETFTDASLATRGLRAEVYSNTSLAGAPHTIFTDTMLDHRWTAYEPHPVFPATASSVRWTGMLMPPLNGEYTLTLDLLGGVRVFLNDQLLLDRWNALVDEVVRIPMTLQADTPAALRIELCQRHEWGKIVAGWKRPDHAQRLNRALEAASKADHILLTLGLTPDLEGEEMKVNAEGFHGGDRTTMALPACQRELLEKVSGLGKPVTVLLTGGSCVTFDTGKANAILHTWYYGQRGGDAVAAALLGEFSPGGRLPVTFYQTDSDLPPFDDYRMNAAPGRTYRYFTGKPLYPFGHGLSYASFRYGKTTVTPADAGPGEVVTVSQDITNTGTMAADEVLQIYAMQTPRGSDDPLKRLVGFQRITLAAGETRKISIKVPVQTLRHWDELHSAYAVMPGKWELHAGASSADFRSHATLHVKP